MSKNFIYFPSFSAGAMGNQLEKGLKLDNGLPLRFYSDEFPERYRHPEMLITAGHHFKYEDYRNDYLTRPLIHQMINREVKDLKKNIKEENMVANNDLAGVSNASVAIFAFCPNCGFNNSDKFKFCPQCGTSLSS